MVPSPPEGEHFEFAEHGGVLVLTVRSVPNWWHMLPASALMLGFMVCMFKWLAQPAGLPWPFLGIAAAIGVIGGAAFLWVLLDSIVGYESLQIDSETIRVIQRTLLPMRWQSLCRRDAHDLRVLQESPNVGSLRLSCYSKEFGRIGLTYRGTTVRFGTPLNDEEAIAVCGFLLAKCPDLGARDE